MKLRNRTILVTGGTSGMGLEWARQLAARGNTVIVTGRDQAKLDSTQRALLNVHAFRSDVGDRDAITALRKAVLSDFPEVDTLINNAGIMRNLRFGVARRPDDVTREIDTDLSGPVRMVEEFLPHLLTRPDALIVNVSSGLAFIPFPASPVYSAAKAAIHSFTQSLRVQLRGTSVTVVELAPPGVETQLFRGEFEEETRGQKAMAPDALVRRAIGAIEAGKLEIRPGLSTVLYAMSRVAPKFMLNQIARMSKPSQGAVRAA